MKKFLLSMAAVACAASMSAASYNLYSANARGTWNAEGTSYVSEVTVNGKNFKITYAKGSYDKNLVAPTEYVSWRCYKGSEVTVTSTDVDMKTIVVGMDDYVYNNETSYYSELTMSDGWSGSLNEDDLTYTATNAAGAKTVTFSPTEKQVRIVSIIVSDEAGNVTPSLPEGVIYENAFSKKANLDDWTITYVSGQMPGTYEAWYVNEKQKCLCASSYDSASKTNVSVDATLSREFDLAGYENCSLAVSQAFGFFFPTSQTEAANYTLSVIDASGAKQQLNFANYGAKGSGNWTSFADNTFDLSEYDGQKITLVFDYNNVEAVNCTWELKNFVLKGDKAGAVNGIEVDENAPAVYYNLQGVRVANPENGLFIVVKGGKSTKVVL